MTGATEHEGREKTGKNYKHDNSAVLGMQGFPGENKKQKKTCMQGR